MLSKANFCAFFAISPPFDLYFVGFFVHFVDDFDDLPLFSLFSGSFAEGQMPSSFSAFRVVVSATSSREIPSSSARKRAVSAV
jgi:hypothetical protein